MPVHPQIEPNAETAAGPASAACSRTPAFAPARRERRISLAVLALLALTAGGLLIAQSRFSPERWRDLGASAPAKAPAATVPDSSAPAAGVRSPDAAPPALERAAEPDRREMTSGPGASGALQGRLASPPREAHAPQARAEAAEASEAADLVEGLRPLGLPERYDAATLADKIDGKAELYLSAGFRGLTARRFGDAADPARWLERFVYDMGGLRNAFAVESAQRRPGAEALEWAADGYRSANGLFFIHGPFYVEIIAADDSTRTAALMASLGRRFQAATPLAPAPEQLPERSFFPAEGLVADSLALIAANAFGIEKLDWIYTARYQVQAQGGSSPPAGGALSEATAFVSRRADAAEAAALADAFAGYFIEYGAQEQRPPEGATGIRLFAILDVYVAVFTVGPVLAGVHEAADPQHALGLADALRRTIEARLPR